MLGCFWESQSVTCILSSLKDRGRKERERERVIWRNPATRTKVKNIKMTMSDISQWLLAVHVGVFSCTLNSPHISQDAFEGGWQKNGLNGVCWWNTYQICSHALVGCSICKAYGFCWGCGSIKSRLLSSSPCYSDVEEERRKKVRGERKELLITCFVWSESPCKYMNSKCRKSNLVVHWYILLFAYLPAPVVSSCVSGLGTSNTQDYAYIFFHYSTTVSCSFSISPFFVSFSILSIFSDLLFASPPLQPPASLIPFPLSPSDIRVYFPPGRMHDRGAGGTESKWQISLSLSLYRCLSISPSVLPEALLSLASSLLWAPSHPVWPHWYSNVPRLHSTFSLHEGLSKPPRENEGELMYNFVQLYP